MSARTQRRAPPKPPTAAEVNALVRRGVILSGELSLTVEQLAELVVALAGHTAVSMPYAVRATDELRRAAESLYDITQTLELTRATLRDERAAMRTRPRESQRRAGPARRKAPRAGGSRRGAKPRRNKR